ncbi:MAG: hypothetical protein IM504_13570 [Microcystis sp. M038S2]|uniref:hypothetical protein n=1 Tax=unclassified Microcystis TaxID=2643300 RepID=UPI002587BF5D|nr:MULTISPECIES: hypothetical protein [unclassified Microcystis]MCA2684217.1 hypothetical protein [Microcystis sp. M046S2]MCA2705848.1 hypothetical protein [Microcystis sp. M038S2]
MTWAAIASAISSKAIAVRCAVSRSERVATACNSGKNFCRIGSGSGCCKLNGA